VAYEELRTAGAQQRDFVHVVLEADEFVAALSSRRDGEPT
jgi:hypothetical protein